MSFSFFNQGFVPEDSYSRQLDKRVARDEFPYGYDGGEPPQGHANMPPLGDADEHYVDPSMVNEKKRLWRK